jgi:hypothetical protein
LECPRIAGGCGRNAGFVVSWWELFTAEEGNWGRERVEVRREMVRKKRRDHRIQSSRGARQQIRKKGAYSSMVKGIGMRNSWTTTMALWILSFLPPSLSLSVQEIPSKRTR